MNTVLAISNPASDAQIKFLRSLMIEKLDAEAGAAAVQWLDTHKLSKATASAKITKYLALPTVRRQSGGVFGDIEEGMYVLNGEIFKVYTTREGHLTTKQLVEGKFEYTGQRPLNSIKSEHRMTLDEAKAYGKLTSTCCQCGRKLTDETSIAEGIGPRCSGKI